MKPQYEDTIDEKPVTKKQKEFLKAQEDYI